jgi:nucleoside-diphosphate-sugar epimerase
VPDVSRAERALGLAPQVSLEEGLRRTYAWYAEQLLGAIG